FSLLMLLLCFTCCLDSEVTLVKTIGKESDFTPICTNETSNIIIMIVCKIRTERSNGEQCSLRYRDGGDFVHECDSRFSLKTRNQTVFLHLTSLTAADSGNYSCQCSKLDGTHFLHLRIIVNGE
uniref:Immunoglobulin V-set domain-containing protein n=1 Tax=Poecilia formosa TaxID=48698 RepID=A0A096LYC3_POEFO